MGGGQEGPIVLVLAKLTRNLILLILKVLELRMWSARRPGVATTTWGWLESSKAWVTISVNTQIHQTGLTELWPATCVQEKTGVEDYPFHQQWCSLSGPEASPGPGTALQSDRPAPWWTTQTTSIHINWNYIRLNVNLIVTVIFEGQEVYDKAQALDPALTWWVWAPGRRCRRAPRTVAAGRAARTPPSSRCLS